MNNIQNSEQPSDQFLTDLLTESQERLELPGVLEEVAAHALSSPGKAQVLATVPEADLVQVTGQLDLVAELKDMLSVSGPLGLADLIPLEGMFSKLDNPATVLEPEEILVVAHLLGTVEVVQNRLAALGDRFELLREAVNRFRPLPHIQAHVDRVLDRHGLVRSSASPGLSRIRQRHRSVGARIRKQLEAIVENQDLSRVVQEDYVTVRNDRCVILLRPEFKGLLDGIIHDHSRSGASVYVEPLNVVELNNEVASLMDEERDEIRRIFAELTEEIRQSLDEMSRNYRTLAWLDAFQARASYAAHTSSIAPEIMADGFRILGARHPLLRSSEVVPMDVTQESDTWATVISGANMGGKTVALKIAGLFPLMTRCGIMLPALEGTKIQPFSAIMADIGDDQDIRGKVSSFSGHMLRIKVILEKAGPGDLVLLDELGGATDPEEGSALAMAIVDELVSRGSRTVVTTHLTSLKAYAMGGSGVNNVSVEFHPDTLEPTFRLLYDLPGESHAISTAERIGLLPGVVSRARGYVDKAAGGSSGLMARLREKLADLETRLKGVEEQRLALDKELQAARAGREAVAEEFRMRARDALRNAERQVKDLQRALKRGLIKDGSKPTEIISRIREEVSEELGTPLEKPVPTIQVGARVIIKSLGKEGAVREMLDRGRVEVALGNVRTRADVEDLLILEGPDEKSSFKKDQVRIDIPLATPRREVNVVGLRVHEALPVVDKAVDNALLGGLSSIDIIHGKGTGRLKKAIRDHLDSHTLVRDFHAAGIEGGGEGVTVVELDGE